jgi:hypothetical protein
MESLGRTWLVRLLLLLVGAGLLSVVKSCYRTPSDQAQLPVVPAIDKAVMLDYAAPGAPPGAGAAPEPAPGTRYMEQAYRWRTFAAPLPIGSSHVLLFQREGQDAIIWRHDWITGKAQIQQRLPGVLTAGTDLKSVDADRYTALQSAAGTWLLGPRVLLLRAGAPVLEATLGWTRPVVVALADGSVLAIGSATGNANRRELGRIVRLAVNGAVLEVQDKGPWSYDGKLEPEKPGETYRAPQYGHGAVLLRDGRVLLFGGYLTYDKVAVLDTKSFRVQMLPSMPHGRYNAAVATLPDGRVVIAGGCEEEQGSAVDVFDPAGGKAMWSQLPALPLPLCSQAYNAWEPSLAVGPDGAIAAGGHLERSVQVLRRDRAAASGYAHSWQVAGDMPRQRISGVVQWLAANDIGVAGGVNGIGGCCGATPDTDRVSLAPQPWRSVGLAFEQPAVAMRGARAFVAGGFVESSTGFSQLRFSRVVELLDLATGQVRQLRSLPFDMIAGDAQWLDERRVLLKTRTGDAGAAWSATNYHPTRGASANVAQLGIYDVTDGSWTLLARDSPTTPGFDAARLLAVDASLAVMQAASGQTLTFAFGGKTVRQISSAPTRSGGMARWLGDGRLLLAGGESPSDLVSEISDCEQAGAADCPETFISYGGLQAARHHEVARVTRQGNELAVGTWNAGPSGFTAGGSAAIMADGRIWKVSREIIPEAFNAAGRLQPYPVVIETSDANGANWRIVEAPRDLGANTCGQDACRFVVVADPRDAPRELLFLIVGNAPADPDGDAHSTIGIWWRDFEAGSWVKVLAATAAQARTQPLPLPPPLSSPNQVLQSLGWQLDRPLLWLQPAASAQ